MLFASVQDRWSATAARSIEIEWISVPSGSAVIGRSLAEVELRTHTGASVVAARDADGLHPNPGTRFTFRGGASIGILGTDEQRRQARNLIETIA